VKWLCVSQTFENGSLWIELNPIWFTYLQENYDILTSFAYWNRINVNEAAGQSVFHVHMHLIPRYKGDVENPKGGVRGVIPSKQSY
jgi:hypothetical protein